MYQGNNRAALTSQRAIAAALMELLSSQPYEEISVAAVCRLAGVSRQTFYSLFETKENVIAYLLRLDGCAAPNGTGRDAETVLRQLCRGYSQYVVRQEALLRLLAKNHMTGLLREVLYESFAGCACFGENVRGELRPYAADCVAAAFTSITETFFLTDADPDTLEEVAYALLRSGLFG